MNGSSLSDNELFDRMKQDRTDAFTAIYHRWWESLYNAAWKRLKNEEACKDIVQNVFIDLWNRRHILEIENLPAFLHTAVRFQVYKKVSRNKTYAASHFVELFESMTSAEFRADGNLREQELKDLFDKWLLTLPERRRQIFLMYYKDEMSTREIAEKLNISQKTVQNQVHTATKDMRLRLTRFLSGYLLIWLFQM